MFNGKKWIEYQLANLVKTIASKLVFNELRLKIVKINAGQRLRDMQFARLAVEAHAIPIENAIRRVRILLNLKNHQAVADGVDAAARQKHRIARAHWHAIKTVGDAAV